MAVKGRPRTFDRNAALLAATELFWEKGYTATSISDLQTALNINAPSLYSAFGSKEELYKEALAKFGEMSSMTVWDPLENAATARGAIEMFLKNSAKMLSAPGRPKGCMVTLSAVANEGEEHLGQLVKGQRAKILKAITSTIQRGIKNGELPEHVNAKAVARFYQTVQQGMSIQARDGATAKELEEVAKAALLAWPVSGS